MNTKNEIRQLKARVDLIERVINKQVFTPHADEEFITVFKKDDPDFRGEAVPLVGDTDFPKDNANYRLTAEVVDGLIQVRITE